MYRYYLKLLALLYAAAAGLQLLDIFDLRLHFSQMDLLWRTWTVYLLLSDVLVAITLWKAWPLGEIFFLAAVLSQVAVFAGWSEHFGSQYPLVLLHLVTLTSYLFILTYSNRRLES